MAVRFLRLLFHFMQLKRNREELQSSCRLVSAYRLANYSTLLQEPATRLRFLDVSVSSNESIHPPSA